MLKNGSVINGIYEVLNPIGEGGAGQVYLAWHKNLEKNVVIKRIKDKCVGRINERGEADILKKLHHRYLPQVYDFIQDGGEIYTVIDYVDGNTLMQYIKEGVRFEEFQIVKWLKQLCEALDYLHTQDPPIIHSDIKPSNILIDANGDICLIDFNISFGEDDLEKISGYTAGYASPEQILKAQLYSTGQDHKKIKIDAKSDIFSLGASIYHIMTFQNPVRFFKENKPLWDVPASLHYSKLLLDIVGKALNREPKERYQTAKEMLLDLESMKVRDTRHQKLNRAQIVYNAVFILLLITGIFLTIKGTYVRTEEAFEAEYKRIVNETADYDNEKTIDDAIALLNDEKYADVLLKRSSDKADLLYLVGNAYFEEEDYLNAITYYEYTLAEDDSNPEYYRDFSIAHARMGDIDEAEHISASGIEHGLQDDDLYLVKAEIALAKEEYDKAIQNFEKTLKLSDNSTTLGRTYLLIARAYRKQGNLEKAREMLETGISKADDTWRIRLNREEGSLCIEAIEKGDNSWVDTAEGCYKALTNSGRSTLNDWLNYSLIKKLKGETKEARDILDSIKAQYPNDYRIPMRQAFYEMDIQAAAEENSRDYAKAKGYYKEAETLYEKERNTGNSDEEMQNLESLINTLHNAGWLD